MRNGILIGLRVQAVDVIDGKVLPQSLSSRTLHISTTPFPTGMVVQSDTRLGE